mmetsp:Transcript_39959/g.123465  ORF Transcript_39959/g.123465 Transcript_39959/m.123465 type:complete len:281 (-) Transcript_39959:1286-2128(-)
MLTTRRISLQLWFSKRQMTLVISLRYLHSTTDSMSSACISCLNRASAASASAWTASRFCATSTSSRLRPSSFASHAMFSASMRFASSVAFLPSSSRKSFSCRTATSWLCNIASCVCRTASRRWALRASRMLLFRAMMDVISSSICCSRCSRSSLNRASWSASAFCSWASSRSRLCALLAHRRDSACKKRICCCVASLFRWSSSFSCARSRSRAASCARRRAWLSARRCSADDDAVPGLLPSWRCDCPECRPPRPESPRTPAAPAAAFAVIVMRRTSVCCS